MTKLKIFYEEAFSDRWKSANRIYLPDLFSLENWIFEQINRDFVFLMHHMESFYLPMIIPQTIHFKPISEIYEIQIHMVKNGKEIIFSDGTLSSEKYWSDEMKYWCRDCIVRRVFNPYRKYLIEKI